MIKSTKAQARFVILFAAVIWGSSFVVLKNTLDALPILFILAFRFLTAGALLAIVFRKKLRLVDRGYLAVSGLIGICLFFAYYLQTIGLAHTTPGKNAFLTAVYCVIVPFMFWLTDKKRPDRYNIIAAVTGLTGIGFISLTDSFTVSFGDYMTLASGFFWAAQIVLIARFSRGRDPILLTVLQFFACGGCAAIASLLTDTMPSGWFSGTWRELLYMAIFCTALTLLCQNWGQSKLPPSNAAILLSLEAVFGVFFSVLLYGEALTPRLLAGFCLVFAAVIISETKLSFLPKKRQRQSS